MMSDICAFTTNTSNDVAVSMYDRKKNQCAKSQTNRLHSTRYPLSSELRTAAYTHDQHYYHTHGLEIYIHEVRSTKASISRSVAVLYRAGGLEDYCRYRASAFLSEK